VAKKSSRAEARKVKDRWRSKVWYNINAPEIFGASQIGETLADSPEKLEGRVTQITLQDITGDFSQMHVKLNFQIDRIIGLDAHTAFVGHDLTSDYIRRLTRRKHSKMDGVYDVVTLDGYRIRIKPMAITERRIKSSQQDAIRHEMATVVNEGASHATLPEVIRAMISGEMSKMIFRRCKPIYPIKRVEIRRSQVLGRDFIPDEPVRGEMTNVLGHEEPEPEPAEGEEAPAEGEEAPAEAAPEAPAAADEEESEVDPETVAAIIASFEDIPGIGPSKAQALFDSGLRSVDEVKDLTVEALAAVDGISEALAQKVHEALNE
jgi:small subunit ribosomal protein S3Ae